MQALVLPTLLALVASSLAQDYFGAPPFPYHHGQPFYHQSYQQPPAYQPSDPYQNYPPHFQPLGFPHEYQDPYRPSFHEPTFTNDLSLRSNAFQSNFPSDFFRFPQYDEAYPDLDYNKIPFREPIQIVPSRFPPRVESFVEKLQNRFSIYNPAPAPLPHDPTVIFFAGPGNGTGEPAQPGVEPVNATPAPAISTSTESTETGSPTENSSEAMENTTDAIEASNENRINLESTESSSEESMESTTETSEVTTESSTESF